MGLLTSSVEACLDASISDGKSYDCSGGGFEPGALWDWIFDSTFHPDGWDWIWVAFIGSYILVGLHDLFERWQRRNKQ